MWTRKELKKQAKGDIRRNYWAAIGICFILAFFGIQYTDSVQLIHQTSDNVDNYTIIRKVISQKDGDVLKNLDITEYKESLSEQLNNSQKIIADTLSMFTDNFNWFLKIFTGGLFWFAAIITVLFEIFISLPLFVGSKRFFIKNQTKKINILEILSVFKEKGYFNIVYIMFCKGLSTFVWGLLFIIPGIIKYFEYYMVPYIIADNPNLKRNRVFEISKKMMEGQKWKTFVFILSFILWNLLSLVTFGIAGIFFVNAYDSASFARLYTTLKNEASKKGIIKEGELNISSKGEEVEF